MYFSLNENLSSKITEQERIEAQIELDAYKLEAQIDEAEKNND